MSKPRILFWIYRFSPYKHTFVMKLINVAAKNIELMLYIGRHICGRPTTIVIFYFQFSVVNVFIIPKFESVRTIS